MDTVIVAQVTHRASRPGLCRTPRGCAHLDLGSARVARPLTENIALLELSLMDTVPAVHPRPDLVWL